MWRSVWVWFCIEDFPQESFKWSSFSAGYHTDAHWLSKKCCLCRQNKEIGRYQGTIKYGSDYSYGRLGIAQVGHYARLEKTWIYIWVLFPNFYQEIFSWSSLNLFRHDNMVPEKPVWSQSQKCPFIWKFTDSDTAKLHLFFVYFFPFFHIVVLSHELLLSFHSSERQVFLATWKDIPNDNEAQFQIKDIHLNSGNRNKYVPCMSKLGEG